MRLTGAARLPHGVGVRRNGAMARTSSVVLVEGESDRVALEKLAGRLGRDLAAEGVEIVPLGGITNIRALATRHGPLGRGARLTGLYDAPEELHLRRGLAAAGVQVDDTSDLEEAGFFRCEADLEDELIRALGLDRVEAVIAAAGETRSLHLLAQMPAQRDWSRLALVRRFLCSRSGRKARYAALFVEALDLSRVPPQLGKVLARC